MSDRWRSCFLISLSGLFRAVRGQSVDHRERRTSSGWIRMYRCNRPVDGGCHSADDLRGGDRDAHDRREGRMVRHPHTVNPTRLCVCAYFRSAMPAGTSGPNKLSPITRARPVMLPSSDECRDEMNLQAIFSGFRERTENHVDEILVRTAPDQNSRPSFTMRYAVRVVGTLIA